ncbi:hypothetical protein [Salipaludibacillus neizhouensis]|uniref:hypothetical protein n=1 Tax=Salipaludibacillus neizhouensis TaxID=885475 RepID=UPI0016010DBB|nr:hypothetical protein [Salipaludibacillus neizhouensis]
MFGADIEKITEDETTVTYRISWYFGDELCEKWLTMDKETIRREQEEHDEDD